jgi:hypothetical protein
MANKGVGVGRQAALFDDDDNCVEHRAVLFDYVDNGINVELDADNEDRAVRWRQQKRATVDDGVDKELDVDNVVVVKGLVVAERMSREDGVCFVDDVDDGVNKDDVVCSLRPSQFSMSPVNLCQVQSGNIFSCHNFVTW